MRCVTPRRLALFCVIALAAAVGCSSNNRDKLANTKWESEQSTLQSGVILPAGARVIEFKDDESLTYVVKPADKEKPDTTLTGKWKLNAGDYVTLTFDQALNDRKVHVEKIVVTGETMTMTDSDGTTVKFTLVKANKP